MEASKKKGKNLPKGAKVLPPSLDAVLSILQAVSV